MTYKLTNMVSLHVGFKLQFADIVPVFLEFNEVNELVTIVSELFVLWLAVVSYYTSLYMEV